MEKEPNHPFDGLTITEEEEYQKNYHNQYSLVELVTFIKWCAVQEDINYEPGRYEGLNDWGKDLLFARYFESIKAGYDQNEQLRVEVVARTKNHRLGKPKLWNNPECYLGTLNHRY